MKNTRFNKSIDYDSDGEFSIRDYQRMRDKKRYRNMDNAFRSKNIDAIMTYVDEDLDEDLDEDFEEDIEYE
jgi:hypothetical protein